MFLPIRLSARYWIPQRDIGLRLVDNWHFRLRRWLTIMGLNIMHKYLKMLGPGGFEPWLRNYPTPLEWNRSILSWFGHRHLSKYCLDACFPLFSLFFQICSRLLSCCRAGTKSISPQSTCWFWVCFLFNLSAHKKGYHIRSLFNQYLHEGYHSIHTFPSWWIHTSEVKAKFIVIQYRRFASFRISITGLRAHFKQVCPFPFVRSLIRFTYLQFQRFW